METFFKDLGIITFGVVVGCPVGIILYEVMSFIFRRLFNE